MKLNRCQKPRWNESGLFKCRLCRRLQYINAKWPARIIYHIPQSISTAPSIWEAYAVIDSLPQPEWRQWNRTCFLPRYNLDFHVPWNQLSMNQAIDCKGWGQLSPLEHKMRLWLIHISMTKKPSPLATADVFYTHMLKIHFVVRKSSQL